MWYFETPEPISVAANGVARDYSNDDFHNEHVWGDPFWRESGEAQDALFRCYEAVHGKKRVTLSDEDFEKYKPIATLKGKPVGGANSIQVNRLISSVFKAAKKRPADWPPDNGAAKTEQPEAS